MENDSLSELQSDVQDFQNFPEFSKLQQAVDDIKAKGYDIGGRRSLAAYSCSRSSVAPSRRQCGRTLT